MTHGSMGAASTMTRGSTDPVTGIHRGATVVSEATALDIRRGDTATDTVDTGATADTGTSLSSHQIGPRADLPLGVDASETAMVEAAEVSR